MGSRRSHTQDFPLARDDGVRVRDDGVYGAISPKRLPVHEDRSNSGSSNQ